MGIASADPWLGEGRLKDDGDIAVSDTMLMSLAGEGLAKMLAKNF